MADDRYGGRELRLALVRPRRTGNTARRWRGAGLNTIAVLIGLALCELLLMIAAAWSPAVAFRLQPHLRVVTFGGYARLVPRAVTPDPLLEYRYSPFAPGIDRAGYRNASVPAKCDVLAVGDSMTFGLLVRAEHSWPAVLAKRGISCVYNAGLPGYGPVEYRVVLDEMSHLRPRLVIVAICIGNDLSDAFAAVYLRDAAPFAKLASRDPRVRAEIANAERKESLRDKILRLAELNAPLPGAPPSGLKAWLESHVGLVALARELWHSARDFAQMAQGRAPLDPEAQDTTSFATAASKPQRVPWSQTPALRTVFAAPPLVAASMDTDDPRIPP